MGYCISLIDSDFKMKAENKPRAFGAVKELDRTGNKSGGSWSGGKQTGSWFSWLDPDYLASCNGIEDVLTEWRYPVITDANGNIDSIEFHGEKIGDEDQLWRAIAPFVESGSYLEMEGEDGARWRWMFVDGTVKEVVPDIIWPEPKQHTRENRFS